MSDVQDIMKKREMERQKALEDIKRRQQDGTLDTNKVSVSAGDIIYFAPNWYEARKEKGVVRADYGTYYLFKHLLPREAEILEAVVSKKPTSKRSKAYYEFYLNVIQDNKEIDSTGKEIYFNTPEEASKMYIELTKMGYDIELDYNSIIVKSSLTVVKQGIEKIKSDKIPKKTIDTSKVISDDYEF